MNDENNFENNLIFLKYIQSDLTEFILDYIYILEYFMLI
jgi:hypothetical protein